MSRDLDLSHPAISDLRLTAQRRLPKFAFEYLDSGTGTEAGVTRNRTALDAIRFQPAILKGEIVPEFKTAFMGREYDYPFGASPIGMSGLMWPGAERRIASLARKHNIPYCLSSAAAAGPEDLAPHIGDIGWFQLYAPKDPEIRTDMLKRIRDSGFTKLILTVDVPAESRRERQRRANIAMPPRMTPAMILSMILHPAWSLGMAQEGMPRMRFPEKYVKATGKNAYVHAGHLLRTSPDWDYIRELREEWKGDLLVKGVQGPEDAKLLVDEGVNAIWVTNHSGRQFEAGPGAIEALPGIRAAVGPDFPVIYDSGIAGGLDIMRALALGADFVFLGRAFHYAISALGDAGLEHLIHILRADLIANMGQIGTRRFDELPERLIDPSS